MTDKVFFQQPQSKNAFGFELEIFPPSEDNEKNDKSIENIPIENLRNAMKNRNKNDEKQITKTKEEFSILNTHDQFEELEKDEIIQSVGYENFTSKENIFAKLVFLNYHKLLCYIKKNVYNANPPKNLSIIDFPLLSEEEQLHSYLEKLKAKLASYNKKITKLILFKSLFYVFWKEFVVLLIKNMIFVGLVGFNSIVLNFLISSAGENDQKMAFIWAAVMISVLFSRAFTLHNAQIGTTNLSTRLRLVIICLLYSKLEHISFYNAQKANLGKIINIISGDMNTLEIKMLFLMFFLCIPITIIYVFGLLWVNFGFVSSVIGLCPVILIFFIIIALQKSNEIMYKKRNHYTDERIKLANEAIEGIRLIKMYGWEKFFKEFLDNVRSIELKQIFRINVVNFLDRTVGFTSNYFLAFFLFVSFYYLGHELTVGLVFSAIQLFDFFRIYVFLMFGLGFQLIFEVRVILQRIIDVLEIKEETSLNQKHISSVVPQENIAVKFDDYKVFWNESDFENKKPILTNINATFHKDKLYAIIGKVGSGKTSFLYTLMEEIPFSEGDFFRNPALSIAYVEQEPFIMAATIRANILFGKPLKIDLYKEILYACALHKDLMGFENSDLTEVGEKGVTLSGGQRARISLARALYSEADVYLLDDPLSAIDAKVVKHVFQKAIKEKMKGKCVILVTHQIQFIESVDEVILLNNKTIEKQGKPENFMEIIEEFSKNNEEILIEQTENFAKEEIENIEIKIDNFYSKALIMEQQNIKRGRKTNVHRKTLDNYDFSKIMTGNKNALYKDETHEKTEKTLVILFRYLKKVRSLTSIILMFLFFCLSELARFGTVRIFGLFGEMPANEIFLYTGLLILAFFTFSFLKFRLVSTIILKGNNNIHVEMFHRVIRTPIEFFDTNPAGRILNRFSNDMNIMDNTMIMTLGDLLDMTFFYISMIVTVFVVNPYFIIIVFAMVTTYFFLMRYFYEILTDSKKLDLANKSPIFAFFASTVQGLLSLKIYNKFPYFHKKFINLVHNYARTNYMHYRITRTFAFSVEMFSISFTGMGVFLLILQVEDSSYLGLCLIYLLLLAEVIQWFLRQIIVIMTIFTSVERTLSFTNLKSEGKLRRNYDSYLISNPKIHKDDKWDKNLPALSKMADVDETPLYLKVSSNETPIKLQQDWPQHGGIIFNNVFMKYRENTPFVLKGLTFSITPGEKIGCVGRTGAGKSSITQALFKLVDMEKKEESSLKIDGVDIKDLGLHTLRHSISIIPQIPFVFSGTIRRNLDPLNEFTDDQLWKVLEDVDLKHCVETQNKKLDTDMTNSSSVFSTGQKQLICLARAILKNNKILILDEATANVDLETDKFIQKKIKEKFNHCTILTIAHRLLTIANYDKVLVLEKGVCKEFDAPFRLLTNHDEDNEITRDSYFAELVRNTGETISKQIFFIAKEAHQQKIKTN